MPAAHEETFEMDTRVVYNKGGKKNGYLPDTFDRPPDWENEYSEEDEVFVEHPSLDHSSATKPLMYPRQQRAKVRGRGLHYRCKPCLSAVCCFLFLVLSLGSVMGLVVYFVNKHNRTNSTETMNQQTPLLFLKQAPDIDYSDIVGCDHVDVEDVWVVGIPKLLTESAFRLVDVNQDGVLDVILGFATGKSLQLSMRPRLDVRSLVRKRIELHFIEKGFNSVSKISTIVSQPLFFQRYHLIHRNEYKLRKLI